MNLYLKTHKDTALFSLRNPEYKTLVDFYLFGEMERDVLNGDITTESILKGKKEMRKAIITAKSSGVFVGKQEVEYFLNSLKLRNEWKVSDGELIKKGKMILEIEGEVDIILKVERVILNFIGRLSGVASLMHEYVQRVSSHILICPTRKTLWGLLDKKACVLGGGGTHRLNLNSAVLMKENHISLFKDRNILGLKEVINELDSKRAEMTNSLRFIEIEVENEKEFFDSLEVLKDLKNIQGVIMFDNFTPEEIKRILKKSEDKKLNSKIVFEASGGITLDNVRQFGMTEVNIISVGAITHSAKNFDFSLRIV